MPRFISIPSSNSHGIFSAGSISATVCGDGFGNRPRIISGVSICTAAGGGTTGSTDEHPLAAESFTEEQRPKLAGEAFRGIAGEFVVQALPETEADEVGLLVSFRADAGSVLGKTAVAQS